MTDTKYIYKYIIQLIGLLRTTVWYLVGTIVLCLTSEVIEEII